jgi:hypothetical protein
LILVELNLTELIFVKSELNKIGLCLKEKKCLETALKIKEKQRRYSDK